jgi:hypothetical protein
VWRLSPSASHQEVHQEDGEQCLRDTRRRRGDAAKSNPNSSRHRTQTLNLGQRASIHSQNRNSSIKNTRLDRPSNVSLTRCITGVPSQTCGVRSPVPVNLQSFRRLFDRMRSRFFGKQPLQHASVPANLNKSGK